ncbi:UNVERIFIED_CONTAM: hypothetical protein ACS92_03145 [Bacillus cereus]
MQETQAQRSCEAKGANGYHERQQGLLGGVALAGAEQHASGAILAPAPGDAGRHAAPDAVCVAQAISVRVAELDPVRSQSQQLVGHGLVADEQLAQLEVHRPAAVAAVAQAGPARGHAHRGEVLISV